MIPTVSFGASLLDATVARERLKRLKGFLADVLGRPHTEQQIPGREKHIRRLTKDIAKCRAIIGSAENAR